MIINESGKAAIKCAALYTFGNWQPNLCG